MTGKLFSLNVGTPGPLTYLGKEVPSSFVKTAVSSPVWLNRDGLSGDEQADLKNHGGLDKAVCVYPQEHYGYWSSRLHRELPVAAFGENFTAEGMLEEHVCIGDVYEVGGATVQVSQPRQPCFKLAARHEEPKLALWVQETGLTGFYFRCFNAGWVSVGEFLRLVHRHPREIKVAEANRLMHHDKDDIEGLERLLAVNELSLSWRRTFERRLLGQMNSTGERLHGPTKEPA
jgi:MOSC domain-containing protein YiiM